jgi:hypothetical protein
MPPAATSPHEPRPLPESGAELALDALGERLFTALASGRWEGVLLDGEALADVLQPPAVTRATLAHRAVQLSEEQRRLWGSARYGAICVQQGRLEPASGPAGLRSPGFLFERALLIGREPGGGQMAGWVEGRFLNTDAGFGAVTVERVETPRRDHADLELAVCELRASGKPHKD